MRKALALALALALGGCATYREDLNRGQRLYEESQYDKSLAIWRVLESDMDSLEFQDQARYAYLRGMTDFSLGFRPDARHWLAVAKAVEQEHPGGLSAEWKKRIETTLDDLNGDWFRGAEQRDKSRSTADVTTKPAPGDEESGDAPAKKKSAGCSTNADCPDGQACQSDECVPL